MSFFVCGRPRGNEAVKLVREGNTDAFASYVAKYPSSVDLRDSKGTRPLLCACSRGNLAMVEKIISLGADLNLRDVNGATSLQIAIERNHGSIAAILVEKGANISTHRGNTPLHVAALKKCSLVVPSLLDAGIDINAINSNGDTPLHCALKADQLDIAMILVERDADTTIKDSYGMSCRDIASKMKLTLLLDMIAKKDAKQSSATVEVSTPVSCDEESIEVRVGETDPSVNVVKDVVDLEDVNIRCWGSRRRLDPLRSHVDGVAEVSESDGLISDEEVNVRCFGNRSKLTIAQRMRQQPSQLSGAGELDDIVSDEVAPNVTCWGYKRT